MAGHGLLAAGLRPPLTAGFRPPLTILLTKFDEKKALISDYSYVYLVYSNLDLHMHFPDSHLYGIPFLFKKRVFDN